MELRDGDRARVRDAPPDGGRHPSRGGSHGLTPEWEKPFLEAALALRFYRLPTNRRLMRWFAYGTAVHEETPEAVVDDFLETNPMPRRRSAWETVSEAFWGYDGRPDLDRVDAPTLAIHGPADRIVPMYDDAGEYRVPGDRFADAVECIRLREDRRSWREIAAETDVNKDTAWRIYDRRRRYLREADSDA